MIIHGCLIFLVPLYLTTLFPTQIRLNGVAISYNLAVATLGGLAIIITALIEKTHMIFLSPVMYIEAAVVLAIIVVVVEFNSSIVKT